MSVPAPGPPSTNMTVTFELSNTTLLGNSGTGSDWSGGAVAGVLESWSALEVVWDG